MSKAYLSDMDGVLIRGSRTIPGAVEFVEKLKALKMPFLVLTNNSRFTPRDQQARLQAIGLDIEAKNIFTSALATARFLDAQRPRGSAFVIGEAGLTTALHEIGYVLEGKVKFAVNHEPARIYGVGKIFFEETGALHSTWGSVEGSLARVLAFMVVPKATNGAAPRA